MTVRHYENIADYRFTGQRQHQELGLYFYQARWYDVRWDGLRNLIP
jgi:hypothetical protein